MTIFGNIAFKEVTKLNDSLMQSVGRVEYRKKQICIHTDTRGHSRTRAIHMPRGEASEKKEKKNCCPLILDFGSVVMRK